MRLRAVGAGVLGVAAALAWGTLIVAQVPRLEMAVAILAGSSEPLLLRVIALPSALQGLTGLVLALPMLVAAVAVILERGGGRIALRACAAAGLIVGAGVVLSFGGALLVGLGSASGSRLGAGAAMELVGAANLVVLHGAVLHLLSRHRGETRS